MRAFPRSFGTWALMRSSRVPLSVKWQVLQLLCSAWMAVFTQHGAMQPPIKNKLSGSTDGRGVLVVATVTPGTTVHTAVAGTGIDNYDEVWIWIYNGHTAAVLVTVEFGGATVPNDNIVNTITNKVGLVLMVPGIPLQNTDVVKIFAATTNVCVAFGFVNAIRPQATS